MANRSLYKGVAKAGLMAGIVLLASFLFLSVLPRLCNAEMITVPDVKGHNGLEATSILEEKGFKVYSAYLPSLGISAEQAAKLAARTQITYQKPEAGTKAEKNSVVTIGVEPAKQSARTKAAPIRPSAVAPGDPRYSNDPATAYQQSLKEQQEKEQAMKALKDAVEKKEPQKTESNKTKAPPEANKKVQQYLVE